MKRTLIGLLGLAVTFAQKPESATEPNGTAIPYPFVHLVHTDDPSLPGGTAYLRAHDPFLFYELGRDLTHRQFTLKQGVYGRAGELSVPLYSATSIDGKKYGTDVRFARDHTSSCDMCHSTLPREPGAGQTIASTGGWGRNTPHFYGAGLVEMIGEQIRREIYLRYDKNRNGRIDAAEVKRSSPVRISPAAGKPAVDYGDLSPGADGVPRLNSLFRIWYLDAGGRVVPNARSMNDKGVVAFDFAPQMFGWGRGVHQHGDGIRTNEGAEAATAREIFSVAADVHMGLESYDPTQRAIRPQGSGPIGGIARVSLNGAQQYDLGAAADYGRQRTPGGISLDDNDGDGHISELMEGDLDAAEFYLLNAPPPAVRATPTSEHGREVLIQTGCVRCHVEDWQLRAADGTRGFTGDRRFFEVRVTSRVNAEDLAELSGRLVMLAGKDEFRGYTPRRGSSMVERIYSDFKHWDLGPGFNEQRYDGSIQTTHRTSPLWGVGSTAPYGHSGQFPTLRDAILAHGGEAEHETEAFRRLPITRQQELMEYLQSLVLYPTDDIPMDINGDGAISERFKVGGKNVGFERFDPRFLFAHPPDFKLLWWSHNPEGRRVPLMLLQNVADAYQTNLPYRKDQAGCGFPDVMGPIPQKAAKR